jgi:hypothetical protein
MHLGDPIDGRKSSKNEKRTGKNKVQQQRRRANEASKRETRESTIKGRLQKKKEGTDEAEKGCERRSEKKREIERREFKIGRRAAPPRASMAEMKPVPVWTGVPLRYSPEVP